MAFLLAATLLFICTMAASAGDVQLDYSVTEANRSCADPGELVTFTCVGTGGFLTFTSTRFPSNPITFLSQSDQVPKTSSRPVEDPTFTATLTEVDGSVLTATLTVVASEEVSGTVGCTSGNSTEEEVLCLCDALETPRNLMLTLMQENFLFLSWDPPSNLPPGVETTYNVTVVNPANGMVYPGFPMSVANTSVEFEELDTSCQLYEFMVTAENDAGSSDPTVIRETIPISPDVTSVSDSLMATVSFSGNDVLITLTFNRATACSTTFGVESYNISLNGESMMQFSDLGSDPVNITLRSNEVSALLPDTEYSITVTACSSLTCRQAEPITAVTTDVQSANVSFVETRVLLSCELAGGSPALGCVFIFTLNSEAERFDVSRSDTVGSQRRRQMDTQAEVCQTTLRIPDVYDSVQVVDWESDGSEGTLPMTVVPQEDPDPDNFVCPTTPPTPVTTDSGTDIDVRLIVVLVVIGVVLVVIVGIAIVIIVIRYKKKVKARHVTGKGPVASDERKDVEEESEATPTTPTPTPPTPTPPTTLIEMKPLDLERKSLRSSTSTENQQQRTKELKGLDEELKEMTEVDSENRMGSDEKEDEKESPTSRKPHPVVTIDVSDPTQAQADPESTDETAEKAGGKG